MRHHNAGLVDDGGVQCLSLGFVDRDGVGGADRILDKAADFPAADAVILRMIGIAVF